MSAYSTCSGYVVQAALFKVLKERGQKSPLRYVERISVERVSLGNAPPMLCMVRAQSSPADKLLRLDFGLGFAPAAGFRVVVNALLPSDRSTSHAVHCLLVVRGQSWYVNSLAVLCN